VHLWVRRDNESGVQCQCASNTDALTLSTTKLVRISSGMFRPQCNKLKEFVDPLLSLLIVIFVCTMRGSAMISPIVILGSKKNKVLEIICISFLIGLNDL